MLTVEFKDGIVSNMKELFGDMPFEAFMSRGYLLSKSRGTTAILRREDAFCSNTDDGIISWGTVRVIHSVELADRCIRANEHVVFQPTEGTVSERLLTPRMVEQVLKDGVSREGGTGWVTI